MPIYKWSKTAVSNATADPTINWAEGMAPSAVNDSARAEMAAVAKWRDDISGTITTGGTSTAYTVTTNSAFDSLASMDGAMIAFVPHTTSGASPTLNVDGLGAKQIRSATGVNIATGVLISGTPYQVVYKNSSTEFILLNYRDTLLNATITGTLAVAGATTLNAAVTVSSGGLTVSAGGAAITGNSSITGTLSVSSMLTASSGFTVSTGTISLPSTSVDTAALKNDAGITLAKLDINAKAFQAQLIHVQHQASSGTNGGTFTSGAWQTRTLNTSIVNEISGASLASNQVTLPAGTYWCEAKAIAKDCGTSQLRLRNVTDSTPLLTGLVSNHHTGATIPNAFAETIEGRFALPGSKAVELQHQCSTTRSTDGWGSPGSFGTEVYADLMIWKIA